MTDSFRPTFLLSMPQMQDPNFSRTVVLLCDFLPDWSRRQVASVQYGVGERGPKSVDGTTDPGSGHGCLAA